MAHILVAEDEPPIAELLAEYLVEEGYSVQTVRDGASALMTVRARQPDLLILDIGLPVMMGGEVLSILRQTGYTQLPIIICSAGRDTHLYLKQGATAIVPKPYNLSGLLQTITQYI